MAIVWARARSLVPSTQERKTVGRIVPHPSAGPVGRALGVVPSRGNGCLATRNKGSSWL